MPPAARQWDPYAVLDIEKSRTRCRGWAATQGRRCHNPIAGANLDEVHRIIAKISRYHPSSHQISIRLDQIAHLLLCRHRHQGQAISVVEDWEEKMNDHIKSVTEHENDDSASGEEEGPTDDLRVQMAECQRLLTRVATALSTHQDTQLAFEVSSVATDTSPETIQGDNFHETSASIIETTPSEEEPETEIHATELDLGHIEALVRQLALERDAGVERRLRVVRSESLDDHDAIEVQPTVMSNSPGTVEDGATLERHLLQNDPEVVEQPGSMTIIRSRPSVSFHSELSRLLAKLTPLSWFLLWLLYVGVLFTSYCLRDLQTPQLDLLGIEGPSLDRQRIMAGSFGVQRPTFLSAAVLGS